MSFSHCWWECDCKHSRWSSSKSVPGEQTPGVPSHPRHSVCKSCISTHPSEALAPSLTFRLICECVLLICLACKCSRSPGGPHAAEGRDGCLAHRSGCHSSGSGGPSGDTGHGVCSGFYHPEPSSVADASNGHSGHTRYVHPHQSSMFLDAPNAHFFTA